MVDAILDVTVHKGGQVVDCVADAVVGNTALWIVVGTDLGRAVTGRNEGLATRSNVVHILLVLVVIDEGTQASQCPFLVLGLIAGFGTLDEDFLLLTRVRVGPHVTQTHTTVHLVHVLATGTATAEGIPLDFTLIDVYVKRLGLRQYSHACSRCMYPTLGLGHRHALNAVHARLILQSAIDVIARDTEYHFLETAHSTLTATGHLHVPALGLAVAGVHARQITGEQGCLVTARSATNFEYHVLAVFRILGDEKKLDFLFHLRHLGKIGVNFISRHRAQLLVALGLQNQLGLFNILQHFAITMGSIEQCFQALIFLGQLDIATLVGNDVRVGNQGTDLFKAGIQAVKTL